MARRPTLDQVQQFYRALYFGDPGLGKSTAIAAAARRGKVVYIDADEGLKGKALRRHGIPIENIEPHYDLEYAALEALHLELVTRLADGEPIFALAWDTTTKTEEAFLSAILPGSVEKTRKLGKTREMTDVYLEDRGQVATMMRELLRKFHGLPCHLILGAHQRRDKDDDGAVMIRPGMMPSVITSFAGWMDCVLHMRTTEFPDDPSLEDGLEFSALTRPRGKFQAKDRFGILPPVMANPGFDRVLGYYEDELDRITDPLQIAARVRRESAEKVPEPTTETKTEEEPDDEPEPEEDG